jgi:hypothetical protein
VPPPAAPLASGPEVFRRIQRRERGAAATHQDCHRQAQEDHSAPRNGRHHANQLTGHVAEPTLTATGCLPARPAFGPKGMSRPLEAAPSGSRLLLLPLEQSAGTAEPHSRRRFSEQSHQRQKRDVEAPPLLDEFALAHISAQRSPWRGPLAGAWVSSLAPDSKRWASSETHRIRQKGSTRSRPCLRPEVLTLAPQKLP